MKDAVNFVIKSEGKTNYRKGGALPTEYHEPILAWWRKLLYSLGSFLQRIGTRIILKAWGIK